MQPTPRKTSDPAAQLAQKVAHELNSPLDGVMRFISLAQRRIKEGRYEDIERYLADAEFGLKRMADILRDLTDTPTPVAGPFAHLAPLGEILEQSIRTLAPAAERRAVSVCLAAMPQPSPQVDVHLYQVLCNILRNALEASPPSGKVTIAATFAPDNVLSITITDSGPGLSAEVAAHLFEPFFTTKSHQQGMGLGLALSRDILTKLGGTIRLQSRSPDPGCQAVMTLPLALSNIA
jgi:signal transduction histidine kinase